MIETTLKRIEYDGDPRQCQTVHPKFGQCPYQKVPNTENCERHSAKNQEMQLEKQEVRNYQLGVWQARVGNFSNNSQVKSLREEIGILRIVLENIMNTCQTPNDLIMYSGKITDTVTKIEKVVSSCHRMEASLGLLLDKATVQQFADELIKIIAEHVQDETVIIQIATQIGVTLERSGNKLSLVG